SIRTHDDEAGSSSLRLKRARITKNIEEALIGNVLYKFLLLGNCNMTLKNRYNTNLDGNLSKQIYSPFIIDWNVLNTLGYGNAIEDILEVRVNDIGSDEVLFTSEDYGFETYCTGGYDKVQKNELWLLSMFEVNHQNGYGNVTWLIAKWMKKKGVGTERESLICCRQFVMRIVKRLGILSNEVLNGLSAPTYCRTLDANILRELIGSNRRLIPKEIAPNIPRVVTPRALRPTTSDLYDKISQLETQIGEIERMTRRQSYHSNRYARVLEHIASHFRVTMHDIYNPPSYFEQQQLDDEE
nr:hypothetical protein [Tanacetum cinerariifolium]